MLSEILNDPSKLIFVIVSVFMFFELIMTIVYFFITKQSLGNSKVIKAKITKLELLNNTCKAYITIKDALGKVIDNTIMLPMTHHYRENEEIEVFSHKDSPNEVKINSFMVRWQVPVLWLNTCVMTGILQLLLVFKNIAKYPF